MLEAIATKVASSVISKIVLTGYKKFVSSDYTPYEKELEKVILKSIEEFEKECPIVETDKISFYSSIAVFEELLKSRFTQQVDVDQLRKAIANDSRIIMPTDEQLQRFFILFNYQLSISPQLKDLGIEFHYKEEIFRLSQKLEETKDMIASTVMEFKKEILELNIGATLTGEWSRQLDEIGDHIKSFKAITAQQRLNSLEKRMIESGLASDKKLFSQLYYLQAMCVGQMESEETGSKEPELLVKAYLANPTNHLYKEYAAIGYYILNNTKNATLLIEDILQNDPFNSRAWAVKCFLAEKGFAEVLKDVPSIVKSKDQFVIQFFQWLNAKRYINSIEEFRNLGLDFSINVENEPGELTHSNRAASIIRLVFLLSEFYEKVKIFSTVLEIPSAKNDMRYKYANKILKRLVTALTGTEIETFHQKYFFQYYSTNLILTGDLSNIFSMEREYSKLKIKSHDSIVRMAQAYNNLNTEEGTRSAIKVLEAYDGEPTEVILLFCFLNYSILRDASKTEEYALKYLGLNPNISTEAFLNISSALRQKRLPFTDAIKNKLVDLSNSELGNRLITRLLKVVLYLLRKIEFSSEDSFYNELKSIEQELGDSKEPIFIHVAFGYAEIKKYYDGIQFLKNKISFDEPSEGYKLYCKILFKSEGNKPELLNHLKKWRIEFNAADYELLDMEAYFTRLNKNWKEQARIAKYALDFFKGSDFFLYLFFTGLGEDQDIAGIINHAHLLEGVEFKEEGQGIAVAVSLIKAGLHQQALDLLYKQASQKINIKSRQSLLMLSTHFPPGLMKELPDINIGAVVKYEINGESHLVEVTESNYQDFPQSILLNKKAGDVFSFTPKLGAIMQTGRIIRVCDKYLGLFEEIMKEASNPMSGMDIVAMKFGGDTVEEMTKSFIENFGVQGTIQKENTESLLQKYYLGTVSFSEITIQLNHDDPFDTYYLLSSPQGKQFKAISAAVSSQANINENTTFVLDPTSVCLLYELSKQKKLIYKSKFIVSSLLKALLIDRIAETRNSPESKMTLSITHDRVSPHFYPDDFKEKRLMHLEGILEWINANCEITEVPERFNFIMGLPEHHKQNGYLQLILDNKLLADRENSLLLTDDVFYYRQFRCPVTIVVGTQLFLYRFHNESSKDIVEHLLEHNYIGIPISADLLYEELLKFLSGKENRYAICLENLRYNWNPCGSLVGETIKFIKSLYLNSFINNITRQQVVFTSLSNVLVGLPLRNATLLPQLIMREFKLLPMQQLEVLDILTRIVERK